MAPADCWNWGEWRLKEYIWKGPSLGWFVGSLGLSCWYKRFLFSLSRQHSSKYFFSYRTLLKILVPIAKRAGQAKIYWKKTLAKKAQSEKKFKFVKFFALRKHFYGHLNKFWISIKFSSLDTLYWFILFRRKIFGVLLALFANFECICLKKLYVFRHFAKGKNLLFWQKLSFSVLIPSNIPKKYKSEVHYSVYNLSPHKLVFSCNERNPHEPSVTPLGTRHHF